MHPQFILQKAVETLLDVKQLRTGLLFNMHTKPFCTLKIMHPRKNEPKHEDTFEHLLQKNNENCTATDDDYL